MNQSFTIRYQVLETNSGRLYLVEKRNQNNTTQHYAYLFRKEEIPYQYLISQVTILENSKHYDLFRQFQGLQLQDGNQFYLYDYYENSQFLAQKVSNQFKNKISFSNAEIKLYLKNLLIALYELHSNRLPGRVFSINNILIVQPNERLVLMDFGFGPDIKHDNLDILAPPEYLEQIINKNENLKDFDLKFDIWLIGAFLYHLIKFKPISYVQEGINTEQYKYDRIEQYYQYLNRIGYIPCQTSRYNQNLLTFIQNLLTCNREKRLSFYQIYQHQYIQDLNIENYQQYIEFYRNCEIIEDQRHQIMNTSEFTEVKSYILSQQKYSQFIKKEPLIIKSQHCATCPSPTTKQIKILSQDSIVDNKIIYLDYYSIIMNTPQFQNESFYTYWQKIQLDFLKCYILQLTSEQIKTVLPKYQHPYYQVVVYIIIKMHYINLKEINNYLQSDFFENKLDYNWKDFLDQYLKILLSSGEINSYMNKLINESKIIFYQYCEIQLKDDSQINNITKQSLIDDQSQNHQMLHTSEEFFSNGYKEELEILFQFINSEIVNNTKQEELNQLIQLKQLIYFCLQICTSFQSEVFQEQFKDIGQQNQKVYTRDIINYFGITNQNI